MLIIILHIIGWLVVLASIIINFKRQRPVVHDALYINPLLLAAGIQAVGGAVNLLQKRPEVPDLFTPALREASRGRARVVELLERQGQNLDASLAAAGATGSGGAAQREALIRASTGAVADIDAQVADLITQAGNKQRQLEFQDSLTQFNSRQNAVSEIANAGTSILTLNQLAQAQGAAIPGPNPVSPTIDPLAEQVVQLNQDALAARTLPEGFDINPLRPRVDPTTGRISFGG